MNFVERSVKCMLHNKPKLRTPKDMGLHEYSSLAKEVGRIGCSNPPDPLFKKGGGDNASFYIGTLELNLIEFVGLVTQIPLFRKSPLAKRKWLSQRMLPTTSLTRTKRARSSTNHSPFRKETKGIFCVVLFFLSLLSFSCSSTHLNRAQLGFVNFCDLPQHVGDTVWVKATYSGFEEYWGLSDQKCKSMNVELFIDPYTDNEELFTDELDSVFNQVSANYASQYLTFEIKGVFENKEGQYGHLGSNNGQFKVLEFGTFEIKQIK